MQAENCKNCGYPLVQKATKKTPGQLRKPYYYTAYYYCVRCKKLYHSDKFKIVNNPLFTQSVILSNSEESSGRDPSASPQDDNTQGGILPQYDAEIWTDGACVYNGTPRARAAWAFVSGSTERAGLIEGKQTNNVAEALAMYHALVWAAEQGYKHIKLHSDSQISLNNMKKPTHKIIQNREIFEKIAAVITIHNLKVTYEKVLGHSGDPNNERADKLCNTLATKGSV